MILEFILLILVAVVTSILIFVVLRYRSLIDDYDIFINKLINRIRELEDDLKGRNNGY